MYNLVRTPLLYRTENVPRGPVPFVFYIQSSSGQKIVVAAESLTDLENWMNRIATAGERAQSKVKMS